MFIPRVLLSRGRKLAHLFTWCFAGLVTSHHHLLRDLALLEPLEALFIVHSFLNLAIGVFHNPGDLALRILDVIQVRHFGCKLAGSRLSLSLQIELLRKMVWVTSLALCQLARRIDYLAINYLLAFCVFAFLVDFKRWNSFRINF